MGVQKSLAKNCLRCGRYIVVGTGELYERFDELKELYLERVTYLDPSIDSRRIKFVPQPNFECFDCCATPLIDSPFNHKTFEYLYKDLEVRIKRACKALISYSGDQSDEADILTGLSSENRIKFMREAIDFREWEIEFDKNYKPTSDFDETDEDYNIWWNNM